MRKRMLVSIALVSGLAGVASLAQRAEVPPPAIPRAELPSAPEPRDPTLPPLDPGAPSLPPPPAEQPAIAPASDDPMQDVEEFVKRGREQADNSIRALSQEAETLRARLQKVEAALGRWRAVAKALEQGADGPAQLEPAPPLDAAVPPPSGRLRPAASPRIPR
jgi:hypothetical protein